MSSHFTEYSSNKVVNPVTNKQHDEIDFVDIWLVISRHFRLFFGTLTIVFVVGLVTAFLRPAYYDYSVAIQLGGIRSKSEFDLVEKPETVMATLQNDVIPSTIQQYTSMHPGAGLGSLKIEVSNPNRSDVVILKAKGTAAQQNQIVSILNSVISELDATHSSLLREHVEITRKLLTGEIQDQKSQIQQLLASRNKVTKSGNSGSKALTLLLLDDQVSNLQRSLFGLRQQLEVGLVADVRMTHALSSPIRSNAPVGLTRSLFIMLSLLCGVIFGLFLVFLARIVEVTRERINV